MIKQKKIARNAIILVATIVGVAGGAGGYIKDQTGRQTMSSDNLAQSTVILYTNNTDYGSGEQGLDCIDLGGELKTYYESQVDTVFLLDIGNTFYNKAAVKLEKTSPSSSRKQEGIPAGITQVIRKMNHARYDAIFPGKRDIRSDVGVNQLREWLAESPIQRNFPVLLSNILDKNNGTAILEESGIIVENNKLYGFFGVLNSGLIERGVRVEDPIVTITRNLKDFKTYEDLNEKNFDHLIMVSNLDNASKIWGQISYDSKIPMIILDGNNTLAELSVSNNTLDERVFAAGMGSTPNGVGYVIIDETGQKTCGVITREMYEQGNLPPI